MPNNFPYAKTSEEYIPYTRIEHWCQFDNCFANDKNIGKLCAYNGDNGTESIGIIMGYGYDWMDKKTPVYKIYNLNGNNSEYYMYLKFVKVL